MSASFNWMESKSQRAARQPLDTQSLAKTLSEAELNFANALEEIFKSGTHDLSEVASELSKASIASPIDGNMKWDLEGLGKVLKELNASLDQAYQENGYGA